jgi:hypothetical protein
LAHFYNLMVITRKFRDYFKIGCLILFFSKKKTGFIPGGAVVIKVLKWGIFIGDCPDIYVLHRAVS